MTDNTDIPTAPPVIFAVGTTVRLQYSDGTMANMTISPQVLQPMLDHRDPLNQAITMLTLQIVQLQSQLQAVGSAAIYAEVKNADPAVQAEAHKPATRAAIVNQERASDADTGGNSDAAE